MSARSVTDLSITYADGARLHTKVTMMSAEAKLALARELVAAAGFVVERDWCHDMAKAPRDGDLLDLWCPETHTYPVRGRYWHQEDAGWCSEDDGLDLRPTAWRPLPAPPAAKEPKE